jgi:hypothetical protein
MENTLRSSHILDTRGAQLHEVTSILFTSYYPSKYVLILTSNNSQVYHSYVLYYIILLFCIIPMKLHHKLRLIRNTLAVRGKSALTQTDTITITLDILPYSQGEEWHNFRSKVNQTMMQPRSTKLYVGPIDAVASDFIKR